MPPRTNPQSVVCGSRTTSAWFVAYGACCRMLELAGRVYGRAQASEFRDARAERAKLIVAQPGEVARVGKVFLRQTQLLFHCHSRSLSLFALDPLLEVLVVHAVVVVTQRLAESLGVRERELAHLGRDLREAVRVDALLSEVDASEVTDGAPS